MRSKILRFGLVVLAALAFSVVRPVISGPDPVADARTRLLGTGWDAPDQVRLRWFGVTNFIASFGGHVVLLDGWVITGTVSGYSPITVGDLIAIDPEYIYIGHGHFDHAAHAGIIAEATGAKVVGTIEHCNEAKGNAEKPDAVSCVPVLDAAGEPLHGDNSQAPSPPYVPPTPFGTSGRPAEGPPGLDVRAVMSKHSAARLPDPSSPRAPVGIPNSPPAWLEHPPSPTDFAHLTQHAGDAEGGSLVYRFEWGDFSLAWHDTSGPIAVPGEGGASEIAAALERLRPVDLEIGAIQSFNQVTNGLKDVRVFIDALRAKVFMPSHHDNWLPPNVTTGRAYYDPLVEELNQIPFPERPSLCFITDPENYRTPLIFKTTEWTGPYAGTIEGCWTPA